MLKLNRIYNIDALEGLKQLEDNSVDAIVSDPPYQLSTNGRGSHLGSYGKYRRISEGFMGKKWDVLPSVELLKECLRVLKDGAFAMWLMTPRQDSQLELFLRLREAGFVISYSSLYWVYASGFPKAENISRMVDKKLGYERKTYDESVSEEAKKLDGSFAGFQPKPAAEIIVVSMKPLSEKTYVEQALKNGKGITWLGNGRIPYTSSSDFEKGKRGTLKSAPRGRNGIYGNEGRNDGIVNTDLYLDKRGRFPANLLVSDNVLDNGSKTSIGHNPNIKTTGFGKFGGGTSERVDWKDDTYINDDGGFSKYFSLDAWWNQRIKSLPPEVQKTFPFLYVPKASKSERNAGLDKLPEKPVDFNSHTWANTETANKYGAERKAHVQNHHPTVKPIKLMSYLITLTTQENDIVLDPFIGSGTTAIASILLNRRFIGFEREEEYFTIANNRIGYYQFKQKTSALDKLLDIWAELPEEEKENAHRVWHENGGD